MGKNTALSAEFYDLDQGFAGPEELYLYTELFKKTDVLFAPMCGNGRLLLPLLQQGYTVHGMESDASLLSRCEHSAKQLKVKPHLIQDSLETHAFYEKYHGILVPLGAFQSLYPRMQAYNVLERFKKSLHSGGKLVIDCFVPWEYLYENVSVQNSSKQVKLSEDTIIIANNKTAVNKYTQHMIRQTDYFKYLNNEIIEQATEHTEMSWYYQFEMELMLEKHGFKNIQYMERLLNKFNYTTFIAEL